MDIKKSFSKAARHAVMKQLGTELVDLMYGTLFMLQRGPKLTSDHLRIIESIPSIEKTWRPTRTEQRRYVAKQNDDGTWDVQRISRMNISELQYWTNRRMEIVRGALEDVRALFATNNQVVSPTGRGFSLTELDAGESCIANGGLVKMEYALVKLGNYRDHPAWAPQAPHQKNTPFTP